GQGAHTMKRLIAFGLTAIAAVGLALSQEKIDQRRPAAPDARISVDNVAGSVTILGWSREEVEVTGTLGAGTQKLEFTGERDRITIKVKLPQNNHGNVEGSDLRIHVPSGARLSVGTVSAKIDLSDVSGDVELHTVSGDIHIGGAPKSLDVTTVSG